jgi:hypothetical protein
MPCFLLWLRLAIAIPPSHAHITNTQRFARCRCKHRLIGMFLVVAFSSSLDVAAIEMEMGLPLDYNR